MPTTNDLPELQVDVVEPGEKAREGRTLCVIGRHVLFDETGLRTYFFGDWDPRVHDALLVAGAVQFCDQRRPRSRVSWGRRFSVRVPVHDPELWRARKVSAPLHQALNLVTGDSWDVTFSQRLRTLPPPTEPLLRLATRRQVIIPYSGGLDSSAVACLMKAKGSREPIRVQLRKRAHSPGPTPFASVPYSVPYPEEGATESTARSRGFRFALLGGLAAFSADLHTIIVPESGQGALGPSLARVGFTAPDYRAHPVFARLVESLLLGLLDHQVRFEFPQIWHTKGQTIGTLLDTSGYDVDLGALRSCWQNSRHVSVSGERRQCGICAACMLRRMSIHAAGASEANNTYVWEDLSASRYEDGAAHTFAKRTPTGSLYRYAVAGALHLEHLAQLAHLDKDSRGFDVLAFQLRQSDLGLSEAEIRTNLKRMLQQHEQEWTAFLDSLGARSFVARWVEPLRRTEVGRTRRRRAWQAAANRQGVPRYDASRGRGDDSCSAHDAGRNGTGAAPMSH